MTKLFVLKGDELEMTLELQKDRFVFLKTDSGIYHIDLSDGVMWIAKSDLSNLGEKHKSLMLDNL